ncbi:unnamed protein product [Diatraea saccharalis]|uniref:Uncharacterized protein n=1 Tax=Diatraea saccharalis TaxID=40085 RepID=A0A9N9RBM6_9NEOP|nr:unnamed protein product [Diatraea saccharalis]
MVRRLIMSSAPSSHYSCFLYCKRKGKGKGKGTDKVNEVADDTVDENDGNVDSDDESTICLECTESYADSVPGEQWIQCITSSSILPRFNPGARITFAGGATTAGGGIFAALPAVPAGMKPASIICYALPPPNNRWRCTLLCP